MVNKDYRISISQVGDFVLWGICGGIMPRGILSVSHYIGLTVTESAIGVKLRDCGIKVLSTLSV